MSTFLYTLGHRIARLRWKVLVAGGVVILPKPSPGSGQTRTLDR
jgi:hypothetical protein